MQWVYILKCENDIFYVGETTRLYRRFWEHADGKGGINTSVYRPIEIVAIYKVLELAQFFKYNNHILNILNSNQIIKYNNEPLIYFNEEEYISDNGFEYQNLYVENNIAECMMMHNIENYKNIRGGKYTKFVNYQKPNNIYVKEIPLCNCGLPCDIKTKDGNYFYFRCAKKNMWDDFREDFEIENKVCNFYLEYNKDIELRTNKNEIQNKLNELLEKSYWLDQLVGSQFEFCVGGCGKQYDRENCVHYKKTINLCFDCFYNKNEELKNKYSINNMLKGKCFIDIDNL